VSDGDGDAPDAWDRAASWIATRGAPFALAILIIWMIGIYGHIFTGEVTGDDNTFHFAESVRIADCLRAGDWDFWNPSANAGYASAYYYQVLPQLASAIPSALFGHNLFWFQLSVFLPHVLAPLAAYRGMRLLGATPWQSVCAAAVASFTAGESRWGGGASGTFAVGLYTQTWALTAFPLALGHAARWISHETELRDQPRHFALAIAWGTFVGLCHPFFFIVLGAALVAAFIGLVVRGAVLGISTRDFVGELIRSFLLGVVLLIAMAPIWLPLVFDYAGFGGFVRVGDEPGPGFGLLAKWYWHGKLFDWDRAGKLANPRVITALVPVALVFGRGRWFRWVWGPALLFALGLGLGPHLGKTEDDLIPMVRFLGAMQLLAALGVGAGMFAIGRWVWDRPWRGRWQYVARTGFSALVAALAITIAHPATIALSKQVVTLPDQTKWRHPPELATMIATLSVQPPGRKQALQGAESSFWNLLPYVRARRPALIQMGGGGLQASPNYGIAIYAHDVAKNAWLYDAPYIVFGNEHEDKMPVGDDLVVLEHYTLRRLPAPGLVSPVQVTGDLPAGRQPARKAAIAWLKTRLPLEDQFLEYQGSSGLRTPPQATVRRSGRTDSSGDEADIFAELEVTAPSTIVVRESWHPRWRAYVDGQPAVIRRVSPDFPAVDVPAGAKLLQLRFERPWWATLSFLLWPLLAALGYVTARRVLRAPVEAAVPTLPR